MIVSKIQRIFGEYFLFQISTKSIGADFSPLKYSEIKGFSQNYNLFSSDSIFSLA